MTTHTNCTHPTTSSARAACRKARKAADLIAAASVDSCLDALAGVGMPTPGSGDFEPVRRYAGADYERTTCSRCGGTGRMPYTAYEGRCFKCNQSGKGNGTVLQ